MDATPVGETVIVVEVPQRRPPSAFNAGLEDETPLA